MAPKNKKNKILLTPNKLQFKHDELVELDDILYDQLHEFWGKINRFYGNYSISLLIIGLLKLIGDKITNKEISDKKKVTDCQLLVNDFVVNFNNTFYDEGVKCRVYHTVNKNSSIEDELSLYIVFTIKKKSDELDLVMSMSIIDDKVLAMVPKETNTSFNLINDN